MISVAPETFTKVDFDATRIAEYASAALAMVADLSNDLDLDLQIDEDAATSRLAISSLDPIVFAIDGGALEDYKKPRELGELESKIAVCRLLLELVDRRNPGFGAPGLGVEASTQAHRQAWDVNLYGRVGRLGLRLHKPRFLYNFRNRHGFTDNADRAFEQLWSTDELTWSRITELSDTAIDAVST